MADIQPRIGAPSAPLQLTIGGTAYSVIYHDNLDGTYVLRLQADDGSYTDLATSLAEINALAGEGLSAAELGVLDGVTPGTAAAGKAVVLDDNSKIDQLDITSLLINGTGLNQTAAFLNGIRGGKVTLNGVNPTPVLFQADSAAAIVGTETETFALDNGLTLVVDPDGAGDDTVTFEAAAATSVSDTSPSTDISGGSDTDFKISVDGDAAETVTLVLAGLNSGAAIASAMETQIQALGGNKASVTVAYTTVYTITSATLGTDSSVVITDGDANSVAAALKIGAANGGVETAGTGDAADITAATAAEVAAAITAKATDSAWAAEESSGAVRIYSATTGKDSSLVVNAASTADLILGITGSAYGAQGLNYSSDMANDDYFACATLNGVAAASMADLGLSITTRTAAGFSVECETTADTSDVDLIIIGSAA